MDSLGGPWFVAHLMVEFHSQLCGSNWATGARHRWSNPGIQVTRCLGLGAEVPRLTPSNPGFQVTRCLGLGAEVPRLTPSNLGFQGQLV